MWWDSCSLRITTRWSTPIAAGRVLVGLKTVWRDGTSHFPFEPIEFLEKLPAIIPRPAVNLLLYHGVLAPRARWRPDIVAYRRTEGAGRRIPARGVKIVEAMRTLHAPVLIFTFEYHSSAPFLPIAVRSAAVNALALALPPRLANLRSGTRQGRRVIVA